MFITREPDERADRIIRVVEKVGRTDDSKQQLVPMNRGECVQAMGEAEAIDNINEGKYDIANDQ